MILGVSGLNGAGKGEVVRFLEQRSFTPLSLSDVIREELRSKGLDETRDRMIETGTAMRAAEGPGVLALRLTRSFEPDRNTVIDSGMAVVLDLPKRFEEMRRRPRTESQMPAHRSSGRPADRRLL